ncbi:MAG: AraC family transcriptional regulator [Pseudomonadales bacterium]|jgi:AraC-like DNA-binding protein
MSRSFTSIATITEVIARTLESYQIDAGDMFESLGLPREPFRNPDGRVRKESMLAIWAEAERLTDNPCFGFEVGRNFHPTNAHAVGYAWLASSTLREALERLVRYQRIISTAADMELTDDDDLVQLQIDPSPGIHLGDDAAFTSIIQMARDVKHPEFNAISVHMMRPAPPCTEALAEFFRCPIEYEADLDKITFSTDSVDEPLARNNPALAQASEEVAREYLANLDRKDVVARARVAIIEHLPDGEPSRRDVAGGLHMSERTLARRLSERDYTFSALVDEVRSQLAKEYLRQSRFSVTDVAFLLGFSDQSNFARAFKRWTHESPTEFRARALV